MIFSIPRSKSFMEQFSYQKHKDFHSPISFRHQESPIKLSSHFAKSKELITSQSQSQNSPLGKYKQSPKKQLIYNKCKSKSYDKNLIENKKKVQKQIILKNLNPQQKRIYQDSEENRKIYSGKRLVDPIHQKFNYFIRSQHRQQNLPFVISDFLLEPCKINSKKLESRPFTSQSFINQENDSEIVDTKQNKNVTNRTSSSMARTYQQSWRPTKKNESMSKINQNYMEFTNQLVSMGSKFQSKQFCLDPWQLDPASNNIDSIRIQ